LPAFGRGFRLENELYWGKSLKVFLLLMLREVWLAKFQATDWLILCQTLTQLKKTAGVFKASRWWRDTFLQLKTGIRR